MRHRYRKRPDHFVIAVQVNLDIDGFAYKKWGGVQRCKPGDWIVDNNGDVYTVDGSVFLGTYRRVGPGTYVKTTPVWAEIAAMSGTVHTTEGSSDYNAGDYIVSNNEDGTDAYCMGAEKFESMYEIDE
jgi:hypothetical protein